MLGLDVLNDQLFLNPLVIYMSVDITGYRWSNMTNPDHYPVMSRSSTNQTS